MVTFAPRMSRISGSATAAAMARAAAAKAAGRPVISLTTGEPDFDTPAHIREAAKRAIDAGETRYTAVDGTPALKDAIRAKFVRENGLAFDRDQVIAATGAKQVIFNAVMATISAGDEVIIPVPAWVSYPDIVKLAGGTPVFVATRPENGFRVRASDIAAAITDHTRMLMLNSPSNPTGAALSAEELRQVGAVLADRPDILVICDDIYEHLIYDGAEFATLASVCPDLRQQILTVNGVSKAYAMTGWRLGYAGGPADLIRAMRVLQSQSTTNPSSVSQAAAIAALNGGLDTVHAQTEVFETRRNMLVDTVSTIPGLRVFKPGVAFYLYLGIEDLLGGRMATEEAFVDALLEEQNLGVVGGAGFCHSPYIRLSFAASEAELTEAARRLITFCQSL